MEYKLKKESIMTKMLFLHKFSKPKFSWTGSGRKRCVYKTTLLDILKGAVLLCLSRPQRNYYIIELSMV